MNIVLLTEHRFVRGVTYFYKHIAPLERRQKEITQPEYDTNILRPDRNGTGFSERRQKEITQPEYDTNILRPGRIGTGFSE